MGIYGDLQALSKAEQDVPAVEPQVQENPPEILPPNSPGKASIESRDTVIPRHHATKQPRYHDTIIQLIRTAVKQIGKEAATHRFTVEEKKAIRDIVYVYEGRGIRTNENEISRIGVNFLIEDYRVNGENSILHKALAALYG